MRKERLIILIIGIIVLGAFINALINSDLLELTELGIGRKDRLAEVNKDLQGIKIKEDISEAYSKKEMLEVLKDLDYTIKDQNESLTSAISAEGKGDISINITGIDKIETIRVQSRFRPNKKDFAEINDLYFDLICKMLNLPQSWVEESMATLNRMGRTESNSVDETINGNIVSLGYNVGLDSIILTVDFTG